MPEQTEELNEIEQAFNKQLGLGNEPIRELKKHDPDTIEGWSYIDPYEQMLLSQIHFLGKKFKIEIIDDLILKPYLTYALSVQGKARIQYKEAHNGILDNLKPILAGINNDKIGGLESNNRKN